MIQPLNPAVLPEATGNYTHGVAVSGAQRMVFVSGQVPWDRHAELPKDFASQCRLTWRNVLSVVAWRVGHPVAQSVSYPVAGAMLGISRQGVHDLVVRGKLRRHPDGGVVPESIRDRLRAEADTRGETTKYIPP